MNPVINDNTATYEVGGRTVCVQAQGKVIRIFEAGSVIDPLVKLNFSPEEFSLQDIISVDDALRVVIKNDRGVVYSDYTGDATVYDHEKDFSLAALEGHKVEAERVHFKTQINIALGANDKIYGLGDKAAGLDRRGYKYVQWNTDDPSQHNESYKSLYKSINYVLVSGDNGFYGIFYPDPHRVTFDLGAYKPDLMYIGSENGNYDYFILLGDSPQEITREFSRLVGMPFLPRLKMLGNQQSRWSYGTQDEVEKLVDDFTSRGIPLDYVHLDIDYMDGYRVYTVDENKFPNIKGLTKKLAARGVELVTILDPAVKYDENYSVYKAMADENAFATQNGEIYHNTVWPGDSVYPNYFDDKAAELVTDMTVEFMDRTGVTGIWCDMNEPASFNGPLPDDVMFGEYPHSRIHNLYGDYMVRAVARAFDKKNMRPYVITRACFATSSPFTTVWNGDNQSLWAHLRASLPQIATMNICGFPFDGVDVGGFGGECNKELLIRWTQANIFSPFFRNHSAVHTRDQEPFAFDEQTTKICKKFLRLRYELIPYLYDRAFEAHLYGDPIIRPMFYEYPTDEKCSRISDQIMIGDSLMLAPILDQGASARAVYFPKGEWRDWFNCIKKRGNALYAVDIPLDATGLYMRGDSIIPMYSRLTNLSKKPSALVVRLGGAPASYTSYEDDGVSVDGKYNIYKMKYADGVFSIKTVKRDYDTDYRMIRIVCGRKSVIVPFSYELKVKI